MILVGGWPTPLKNHGVKVSWDDSTFPYIMENKIHVPNHQPGYFYVLGFPPSEDDFFNTNLNLNVSWCVMVCMKMDENGRYHGITIKSPVVVAHIIQAKPCQSWNHVWWSGYLSLRKNFGKVGLKRVSFWIVPSMNDPLWIGRKRILHKSAPCNKMYSKSEKSVKASKWSSISVQSSSIFMDNSDNSSILVRIGPILACCIEIHPQPQHTTAPTRLDHRLWIGSALPH